MLRAWGRSVAGKAADFTEIRPAPGYTLEMRKDYEEHKFETDVGRTGLGNHLRRSRDGDSYHQRFV